MKTFYCIIVLAVFSGCNCSKDNEVEATCLSPQYLELGKEGTISCNISKDTGAIGVLWYNTTDYSTHEPIIHYRNMRKTGAGYNSGEFDVHPNGSLIINNVTLQHDVTFLAAIIHSQQGVSYVIDVTVIVIVKPLIAFPVLGKCGNKRNRCFIESASPRIQCAVSNTRPSVALRLRIRTVSGDRNVSTNISVAQGGQKYTSYATTEKAFYYSRYLSLLVCKAYSPPGMLANNESLILIQNSNVVIAFDEKRAIYVERTSRMVLSCTNAELGFLIWKKVTPTEHTTHEILFYVVLIGEPFEESFTDGVTHGSNGELVVPLVDIKHEGLYYCIYGDGDSDGVTSYEVSVVVHPTPAYPVIHGCNEFQLCALNVGREGNLTCTVKGIRPQVQLVWKTSSDNDAATILFSSQQQNVKNNKGVFDVTLIAAYSVKDETRLQANIECIVVEPNQVFIGLKTQLQLYFSKVLPTEEDNLNAPSSKLPWIIVIVLVLILMTSALSTVIMKKYIGNQRKSKFQKDTEQSGELLPMFPGEPAGKGESSHAEIGTVVSQETNIMDVEGKVSLLLHQLKEKYQDLYDAVQPIPYIRDRLYCVDKIFVEGGIQFLKHSVGTESHWEKLDSYTDMFTDPRVHFNRLILEGDPGYGKSTVTLQIAYDWCNLKNGSTLKNAEILILLRLRQLGGVPSIFKAIRYYLLPRDSQLSEQDVKDILLSRESVVIILDGYDEYPDQDNESDFMEIFKRNMFQKFQVILTTRLSYLPKQYSPQTKRVRLTGFDEKAQDSYIRKAVVGEDNDAVQEIKLRIQENPILSDLCEVPLFFVMFAHMIHESDTLLNFNSVTNFFQHIIACFHEHMKIKMIDKNVKDYDLFEKNHSELDKIAFQGLSEKNPQIVWTKEYLLERLGEPFYNAYIKIGILVEEEVLDLVDNYGKRSNRLIERRTEVRFYHKLFCEWYAAHYLSKYASNRLPIKLGSIIKSLNPFDLQYMYRFACGISPSAGGAIITRLKQLKGGDKFAVLCLLEQTGNFEDVKETIRQMCSEGIIISGHDSKLLQRSYMQLLEIAATNKTPVKDVYLHNCLQSVELATPSVKTTSGLALTSRIPVRVLAVILTNRDMTKDEAIDILQFASMCPSLEGLGFYGSVPPQSFQVDSTLATLKSRNVTVWWKMFKGDPWYFLNLDTGRWKKEDNNEEPTSANFEEMRSKFAKYTPSLLDETFQKGEIKVAREYLRKKAEQRRKNNPT